MAKIRKSNQQARAFFRRLDLRLACSCCGDSFRRSAETFSSGKASGTLGELALGTPPLVTKKDPRRRSKWTPTHEKLLSLALDTFGYELPILRLLFAEFKEKIVKVKAETLLWKKSVEKHSRPVVAMTSDSSSSSYHSSPSVPSGSEFLGSSISFVPAHGASKPRDLFNSSLSSATSSVAFEASALTFPAMPNIFTSPISLFGEPCESQPFDHLTFTPLSVLKYQSFESVEKRTHNWRPTVSDLPNFESNDEKKLVIEFL